MVAVPTRSARSVPSLSIVPAPTRVAIYCRVSSAGQENNSSLQTQEEQCRAYAAERGWFVTAVYREVHSGAELFERPQLGRMRDALRNHAADVVLAYALDRLSRNQAHLGFLLSEWDHVGVRLELVSEEFADSPEGRLLQSVRGFVAEMERMKIRERTRRGLQARVASGKPLVGCRPPYGYRWATADKSHLVVDDERAPIVRRILACAKRGDSLRSIARALTAEGIPTATGRSPHWEPTTVYRILTHPVYAGETAAYRYVRERAPGQKPQVRHRASNEHVSLPGIVAVPFVTVEDQHAIVARLELNKVRATRNNRYPEDSLLRAGFARCGYCGSPLTVKRYQSTRRHAYRCLGIAADRYGCPGFAITAPALDEAVWAQIESLMRDPAVIAREVARLREDATTVDDLAMLDRRLNELSSRQTKLARLAGGLDDEDAAAPLLAELGFLAEQKRQLTTERAQLEVQTSAAAASASQLTDLSQWCARVAVNLATLTYEQKRQILEALHVDVRVWRSDHQPRWKLTMSLPVDDAPAPMLITHEAA